MIGWFIFILIMPAALILWIMLMLKAYRYEYFKFSIIGGIAEKQFSNLKNNQKRDITFFKKNWNIFNGYKRLVSIL